MTVWYLKMISGEELLCTNFNHVGFDYPLVMKIRDLSDNSRAFNLDHWLTFTDEVTYEIPEDTVIHYEEANKYLTNLYRECVLELYEERSEYLKELEKESKQQNVEMKKGLN